MRYVIAALLTLCFLSGGVIPRAAGQVALPPVGLPDRGRILPGLPDLAAEPLTVAEDKLRTLRLDRIAALVRRHPDAIERDARGDPAVRGVLVAIGVDTAMVARARAAGFALIDRERLDSLGLDIVRFRVPDGRSLARAQKQLARLLPDAEVEIGRAHV